MIGNQTKAANSLTLKFVISILFFGLAAFSHATETDSVVSVMADEAGLQLLSPDSVPPQGTFWVVTPAAGGRLLPYPSPVFNPTLPVYSLSDGIFLVDDTADGSGMSATALTAQANSVSNLIVQVQSAATGLAMGRHAMDNPGPPFSGDGGGYTNGGYPTYTFDTNQLWLEITNVADGVVYLNLHNATNEVYVIWGTADLTTPFANWQVTTEVWPTDTNVMPFTVNGASSNLFLRAEDWTGVTQNGNTTPDWWYWEYFGYIKSDDQLDAAGNTFLYDYTNGYNPTNIIEFSIGAANNFVNYTNVSLQLNLTAGSPSYYAIVDAGNPTTNWLAFTTTNLATALGSTDGVYTVSIGLKGSATNIQTLWGAYTFTLERTPPVVSLLNPETGIVSEPVIQIRGAASALLRSLTFGVSNAAGISANQTGLLTGQFLDTNVMALTTNYFQCYDVPLTNGLNVITLQATDLAGNQTTTNFNLTLDYSSDTAPALNVLWPSDGTTISGNSFTFQGEVDQATANVTLQVVGEFGSTNTVQGSVGRTGTIWADNLPLGAGTNTLTVTAIDAAGNSTVTNLTLYQSSVTVTMDPLTGDQLNQPSVDLSGTVSDPTAQVFVNGSQAEVDPNTRIWTLYGLPAYLSGTLTFSIAIYPEADTGGGGGSGGGNAIRANDLPMDTASVGSQLFAVAQTPVVQVVNFHEGFTIAGSQPDYQFDIGYFTQTLEEDWNEGVGGFYWDYSTVTNYLGGLSVGGYSQLISTALPLEIPPNTNGLPLFLMEHGPIPGGTVDAQTALKTDGQDVPGVINTYLTSVQVTDANGNGLPAAQVQIPGYAVKPETNNPTWGDFLVSAPGQASVGVTPNVPSYNKLIKYQYQVTNLMTIVDANSGMDLTQQTNTVIVGQQMNLLCQLNSSNYVATNFQWTVPGVTFSNYVASAPSAMLYTNFSTNNSSAIFCWVDSATNRIVQCMAMVDGKKVTATATFDIVKPTTTLTSITGTVALNYAYIAKPWLHFGVPATGYQPGIQITNNDFTMPSGNFNYGNASFETEWVQEVVSTLRMQETNDGSGTWYKLESTNPVLDTLYPIPAPNDSPSTGDLSAYQAVSCADNFKTWFMFRPSGGQWVPLQVVSWSWSGSGTNTTDWILTSSMNSTNPTGVDTFKFPVWSNNITNFSLQKE